MKEIPLTQGKVAIVDDEDYEYLNQWKWCVTDTGYAIRQASRPSKKGIRMHRVIMQTPDGMDTDHINGNKLDNRRCNLRICTRSQNLQNSLAHSNNTSGRKGVSWSTLHQKWVAQIKTNTGYHYLGLFSDIADAVKTYDVAARKYFMEFARPNFQEEK
jgi:hypothetical protein